MNPRDALDRLAVAVATGFGLGYSPIAPGTVGSLAAVGAAGLLHNLFAWRPEAIGVLGIVTILPAIWTAEVAARRHGQVDPGVVVIDEVAGQWITLGGALSLGWIGCLAGFALFRIFDVWKPFPVRRFEELPGGLGIVADDVAAGLYGALVLYAAGWFNLY